MKKLSHGAATGIGVGPGFQIGAKFKTEPNGEFWGLQYYKSDDWSGLKIQYGFADFNQLIR